MSDNRTMLADGRGVAYAVAVTSIALTLGLGGCQQEMNRTDKGYSIPSFSSASSRSGTSTGSSQNKPTTARSSGSSGATQKKGSGGGGF